MSSKAAEHTATETRKSASPRMPRSPRGASPSTRISAGLSLPRTSMNAAPSSGSTTNTHDAASSDKCAIQRNTIEATSEHSTIAVSERRGGRDPTMGANRKNCPVVPRPLKMQPTIKSVREGNIVARVMTIKSVPMAATNPHATTNAGCVTTFRRRDAHAAAKTSATVEAMRCTMMRFSARRLFSMSCNQNAPENPMLFHTIQHEKPMSASIGKPSSSRARMPRCAPAVSSDKVIPIYPVRPVKALMVTHQLEH